MEHVLEQSVQGDGFVKQLCRLNSGLRHTLEVTASNLEDDPVSVW